MNRPLLRLAVVLPELAGLLGGVNDPAIFQHIRRGSGLTSQFDRLLGSAPHCHEGCGRPFFFHSASWFASFAQQGAEAGLFEVMVRRQGIFQAALLHDYKRNAIDQRPVLIRARREQSDPFVQECGLGGNDRGGRVAPHLLKQF